MPEKLFDSERYLRRATLMNDYFMNICLNNNIPCAEAMLTRILGRNDLRITKVETQKKLPGLGRELILDVSAEGASYYICGNDTYTLYNMEIQNDDRGAEAKRIRYHCGMIDVHHLRKGQAFRDLPESYVIFITRNDVLKHGKAVYTISRYIDGIGEHFEDGQHIIYVNCSAENDGSKVWELIHDMKCSDPAEMLIPELAERVGYFKNIRKGVGKMDALFEEVYKEELAEMRSNIRKQVLAEAREEARAKELAEARAEAKLEKEGFVSNIIKSGAMTLDKIAEAFNMSLAEVQALAAKLTT